MTARHVVLALTTGAGLLAAPGVAGAAGPACPASWRSVDATAVTAQLTPAQLSEADAVGGVAGLFTARDRNTNGLLCQQVGSLGRAPGQPSFYANYKDDRL